ncbi:hypothetical protein BS636_13485 [Acinetobacter sp. LoGeW2-3]|nr:hypothetical protein BS636_13485 [Acinetobacter sp. LoGeW2-3]
MKKLLLVLCLVSGFAYAEKTTTSIRAPSGDLVRVGDSHDAVKSKLELGKPRFYVLNDGRFHCAATEYVKQVDLQEYTIILCRDRIVKILWRNL